MFRMMLVHCPNSVPYSRCTRRCGTSADTRRVSVIVKCMMQVLIPHNVQMKQVIKTLAEKTAALQIFARYRQQMSASAALPRQVASCCTITLVQ